MPKTNEGEYKTSEAKRRANKKWNDKNMAVRYERIQLVVPHGRKETVEKLARDLGQSVNGLMNALLFKLAGMTETEWKTPPIGDTDVSALEDNMPAQDSEAHEQDTYVNDDVQATCTCVSTSQEQTEERQSPALTEHED